MTKPIQSVRDVVNAFGGLGPTSEFLGVLKSTVCNWAAADDIPRGYHLLLYLELQRRGYEVDLRMFHIPDRYIEGKSEAAISAA